STSRTPSCKTGTSPLSLRCIIATLRECDPALVANLPLHGRVEEVARRANGLAIPRPPALVVPLERVEPHARLPHEPRTQPFDLAQLLGHRERMRHKGVLQRVDAPMADAAVLETRVHVPQNVGAQRVRDRLTACGAPARSFVSLAPPTRTWVQAAG